ncbi:MAG: cytochrome c-type biogenesis protein [Rhizobiaceae bacterium]
MRKLASCLIGVVLLISSVSMALAINPDEVLDDPELEYRARSLSAEIRCLVCQNQSIDDSDAQLARDLRILVREKLVEGKSDTEILDFLVARYGEFVLLKPRFGASTFLLWIAPFLILVLVGTTVFWHIRKNRNLKPEFAQLSKEEKKKLSALLDDSG